jgi:putative flippase GtrA
VKDSCRIYKEILKFSASSLVSFLIDYGMFCGLSAATGELVLSNVTARIVSAGVNYTLNKRMVFGHEGRAVKSAASYFTRAVILLILNTGILRGLTALGASPYLAKIGTELLLFLMSYTVQHTVIFRREAERT